MTPPPDEDRFLRGLARAVRFLKHALKLVTAMCRRFPKKKPVGVMFSQRRHERPNTDLIFPATHLRAMTSRCAYASSKPALVSGVCNVPDDFAPVMELD